MKKLFLLVAVLAMTSCKAFSSPSPVIVYFSTDAASVVLGNSATLSWEVTNADSVRISSIGDLPKKGTTIVAPRVTTVYNLSANNSNSLVQQSLTITVK